MRRRVLFVLLFLPLAAPVLSAGISPVEATLENGLRVVVVENHAAPVVSIRFYVNTGSIYEGDLLGHGLSHFLEHSLYLGTTSRTRAEIDATTEAIGNASNAYTSDSHCCYYITTAAADWETGLALTGDIVFNAGFPAEQLERERGVILREIAMNNDEPTSRIYWLFNETMFRVHPIRYPIIGFADLLKATTRDEIVAYHGARYVPDNVVLSIAGDVKAEEAIERCREALGSAPRQPSPPIALPEEPPQTGPRREVRVDERLEKAYLYLGYRTIPLLHPDLYALDVLAYILGHGASSRLDRIVREEKQLVDSVGCWSNTPNYDAGALVALAVLSPEKLAEAEAGMRAELDRFRTELVSNAELSRAKTQKAAELLYARETAEGIAETVGVDVLNTGDPHFSDHYVEGIRGVTREDVQRVARTYFRPEGLCVAALTPKAPRTEAAEGRAELAQSPITKKVLANGLTVLVQQNTSAPSVSVVAAAQGGLRYETAQTNGVTEFMADMLARGTRKRSREALAKAVEDMGAGLSPYSGRNSFGVSAKALREDLDRILELVADVLISADFPPEELEAERHFTLAAIAGQKDDPNTVARRLFLETMYTVHPYRFLSVGTEESIKALTREQVLEYYATYCRPNRTVLALFGDVDPEAGVAAVEKALGKWPAREVEAPTPTVEPPLTQVREARQERAQEQAIIYVGFPGVTVADPRRYVIDVLDAVMSGKGYPGGRLFSILRERQLVYFADARSEPGLDPGAFVVSAGTQPEKVGEVLAIIRQVVAGLREAPVEEEELGRGKRMCIAEHDIGLQSNAARAQVSALDELYALGYDEYARYAERIGPVTSADVQRVAQELLDLDRCVITVVAPEAEGTGDGGEGTG